MHDCVGILDSIANTIFHMVHPYIAIDSVE